MQQHMLGYQNEYALSIIMFVEYAVGLFAGILSIIVLITSFCNIKCCHICCGALDFIALLFGVFFTIVLLVILASMGQSAYNPYLTLPGDETRLPLPKSPKKGVVYDLVKEYTETTSVFPPFHYQY